MVATINGIRDAIAAIYINCASLNCQAQHRNVVNKVHSISAANTQQVNYSELLSALNRLTENLLISLPANAALFKSTNSNNMGNTNASPQFLTINSRASDISIDSTFRYECDTLVP